MAAVFGWTAVFGVGIAAAPVVLGGSMAPPDCRYDDVVTEYKADSEWRMTLLDSIFMVPASYVPSKLVSVSNAGIGGSGRIRKVVIADLAAMAADARAAGAGLRVVSAYRSYKLQKYLFQREVRNFGEVRGRESVARPGHSEHQLGTTIDFGSAGTNAKGWDYSDWAKTKPGAWLKKNGWKYGFLLSYPKRMKNTTCYRYEPWHFRYVGREMAADVKNSGLTLREYLWKNFHQE
jgi:D-alanyl-D-alanine carboxypeptidase